MTTQERLRVIDAWLSGMNRELAVWFAIGERDTAEIMTASDYNEGCRLWSKLEIEYQAHAVKGE